MQGTGFLAIWSDVEASRETDYLHWLTREHAEERIRVPGFLAVRVFRAMDAGLPRYFILYELESPDVVASPAYIERLDSPTPWSRRVMPTLGSFVRGGGRRLAEAGIGEGATIAALRLEAGVLPAEPGLLTALAGIDRVSAVRHFETDQARTAIKTHEKALRGRDRSFATLLVIEGVDAEAVRAALARLAAMVPPVGDAIEGMMFALCFRLDRRQLR